MKTLMEWLQSSRWDEAIFFMIQAIRAWLLSRCPSGTKSIRPIEVLRIILALMGLKPWTESSSPFE